MAEKLYGYAGKLLRVSLTDGQVKEESLNTEDLRKYLGGVGYGTKILYDEVPAGADPLGPENKLILTTSPLTNNYIPGGGSIEFCFKSPLTNGWGESRCGGDYGPTLRKAGYDFLVVEGRADEPVYLAVSNDKVELRPAAHLAGKTVTERTEIIKNELGPDYLTMVIGVGGENLVKYAGVMFGGRSAGRCGAGAVMGSKNLIAIAVKGTKNVEIADPEALRSVVRETMAIIRNDENAQGFKEHGTVGDIPGVDEAGDLPTKNWQSNSWGKGEQIYDYFYNNNLVSNTGCYTGCPVACGRLVDVKRHKYKTPKHDGAEYETIAAFTSFVLNENVDAAVHCSHLCNEYGIDTISTGACIAFAMECYENGLLDESKLDGLEINWGDPDVVVKLVHMIAKREGYIGDLLAEGVKRASDILGEASKEFAIHGKGLEAPAHDPRSGKALAVTYGTGNRGMCHIHPVEAMAWDSGKKTFGLEKHGVPDPETVHRWDEEGKGTVVKVLQDGGVLPDIFTTCKFFLYVGATIEAYCRMLRAITGWDFTEEELLRIGERTINLQRVYNFREGFTAADDDLPKRMKSVPLFGDYADKEDCAIKDFQSMLREYYAARGWDVETGRPTPEKLQELGIEV
ncbi:MAG: aldehyde ferredoxin oxidoreductase family protein [Firmicutes bacterium]|nr:aldehyde ferredoxin oxidoreductase family protein [Bacillota bacterium]